MTTIQLTVPDELAEKLTPVHVNTVQFDRFLTNAIEAWLNTQADQPKNKKSSAWEILQEAEGHQLFKSADEVDQYLQQERDAWD